MQCHVIIFHWHRAELSNTHGQSYTTSIHNGNPHFHARLLYVAPAAPRATRRLHAAVCAQLLHCVGATTSSVPIRLQARCPCVPTLHICDECSLLHCASCGRTVGFRHQDDGPGQRITHTGTTLYGIHQEMTNVKIIDLCN